MNVATKSNAQPPIAHVGWVRSYEQRAAQILAFNQCKGDLDDKLEAVHCVVTGKPAGWELPDQPELTADGEDSHGG